MRQKFLFGLEWECACGYQSEDGRLARISTDQRAMPGPLLREAICTLSPWLPDPGGGVFTPGFRYYLDVGNHPEVASAEVSSPLEFLRLKTATSQLLGSAVTVARRTLPQLVLLGNNHDYRNVGAYWGCHESYATTASPKSLSRAMLPFLASRPLIAGNARIDAKGRVQASARGGAMEQATGGQTTRVRALFSTCRNESLMRGSHFMHRLHLICGDTVRSPWSEFLKLATTALVLAMLQDHPARMHQFHTPHPIDLLSGANTIWTPRNGLQINDKALGWQRRYCDSVSQYVEETPELPAWCELAVHVWSETLQLLADDPLALCARLDPFIKLALWDSALSELGASWNDIAQDSRLYQKLALMDLDYHQLNRGSLFDQLMEAGQIESFPMDFPDESLCAVAASLATRASHRAAAIADKSGQDHMVCTWSMIHDARTGATLELKNPFPSEPPTWSVGT